ncbi:RNA polymerase sigma-70 factor [Gaoshiqia sp. Z1-71]|uniref:RNA polymerase sigma-70 factor n=1 Tax=Gaoshiqia hydrogeniformans TaxID=3290090 RepID=UPI003BF79CA0
MEILRNKNIANRSFLDDERVFEFIFKAYFPRLMAFSKKFVSEPDIAEDIVQNVFATVWINRNSIKEDTFKSYLFTLARNACLNHLKHQRIVDCHRAGLEDTAKEEKLYYADFFSDPFHQTIFNEVRHEIEKIMQQLPGQTQTIFRLSRVDGLKNAEIAEILKISVRTVEKHITRALEKLKTHLSAHYLIAIAVLDLINEFPK